MELIQFMHKIYINDYLMNDKIHCNKIHIVREKYYSLCSFIIISLSNQSDLFMNLILCKFLCPSRWVFGHTIVFFPYYMYFIAMYFIVHQIIINIYFMHKLN
jgi:hypothetical protein